MFIDKPLTQFGQSAHAAPQYSAIWTGAWWSGLIPKPHRCFELPEGLERDLGAQLIIWSLVSHEQPHSALWCCLQKPDAAGWWSRLGWAELFVVWQVAKKQGMPHHWIPTLWSLCLIKMETIESLQKRNCDAWSCSVVPEQLSVLSFTHQSWI